MNSSLFPCNSGAHFRDRLLQQIFALSAAFILLIFPLQKLYAQSSVYSFSATAGTYTALTGGTAAIVINGIDDGWSNGLPIGFNFVFNGVTYTHLHASTNGWATLGTAVDQNIIADSKWVNSFGDLANAPTLAPLWDDLQTPNPAQITYSTAGTAPNRIFTLQYSNMRWNYGSADNVISFQLKLYEGTNVIRYVYNPGPGAPNNASASIGVGFANNSFLAVATDVSTAATVSSTVNTTDIATKPAAGMTFTFTPVCTPSSTNSIDYISGFTTTGGVLNISNTSSGFSPSGYGDFYSTHTLGQYAGDTVSFSETYYGGSHGLSIWVDFNKNGQFEASERLFSANALATGHTGTLSIPGGTQAGEYRMRVRAWWNNLNPDPCASISYGEAEDYKLIVYQRAYCTPTGGSNSTAYYLNNITTTGGVSNIAYTASSYSAYVNNSATAFEQYAGAAVNVSLASAGNSTYYYYCWVDWNNDGDFSDAGETVFATSSYTATHTGNIAVPVNHPPGNYRVRFATSYAGQITQCGPAPYGNFVDYTLRVLPSCTGTPVAGTVTVTPSSGPAGSTYNVTASGYATGTGITYRWHYSDNGGAWTAQGPASATFSALNNLLAPPFGTVRTWRLRVRCTATNLFSDSAPVSFTTTYCMPTGSLNCTANDFISNVTFNTLNNTSTCSSGGYALFPATGTQTTGVTQGGTYTLTLSVGAGTGTHSAAVYIDWNRNGVFDPEEFTLIATDIAPNTTHSATVAVPYHASVGTTRMRVRYAYNQTLTATTACTIGGNYGETEDYTITVVAAVPCIPGITPTSDPTLNYISEVKFMGTLNDVQNTSTYSSNPRGYQNFTALTSKSSQVQGGGINVFVRTVSSGFYKAWVDWNRNDVFDSNEIVYDSENTAMGSTTFGFSIPSSASPGDFRIRIRSSIFVEGSSTSPFNSCEIIDRSGETEDYLFTVVERCPSEIVSTAGGERCGAGDVTVSATANTGSTRLRWYTAEVGGTFLGETMLPSGVLTGSLTHNFSSTSTLYVAAASETCETLVRKPVTATIKPIPDVSFALGSGTPEFCGVNDRLILSTAVNEEQVTLLTEDFEGNVLGSTAKFTSEILTSNPTTDGQTRWQIKQSVYIPVEKVWKPAISSGDGANRFAFATSDVGAGSYSTSLRTTNSIATTNFTSVRVAFDAYYSHYSSADNLILEATDAAGVWQIVQTYAEDLGIGTRFAKLDVLLPAYCLNRTDLQLRFRYTSNWADGVAIDNIRIYGNRPLNPVFTYNAPNIAVYNSDCETPFNGATTSVCLKPTDVQLRTQTSWDIAATVNLSNGCSATGNITIANNNKIWNPSSAADTWNTAEWLPTSTIPTADKCIIVQKPLQLAVADGVGRNLIVEEGGSLNILAPRTLTLGEYVINRAAPNALVVHSDANLIQTDDLAENSGKITVRRDAYMKRLDYTYWSSPVQDQNLKSFSPGTLNSRFYTYNEWDDFFTVINPVTNKFIPGTGYAIRSPNTFPADNLTYQTFYGVFTGIPLNGTGYNETLKARQDLTFNLKNTHNGYNLIGNPYPSNINFAQLVTLNSGKINNLAYFWTNINHNPAMQGSNYPNGGYVNNYATLNGTAGTPAQYSVTVNNPNNGALLESKTPTQYIKVGQGFIIKSLVNDQQLIYNNSIRTGNADSNFFNSSKMADSTAVDRFWIQLITPLGIVNTAAVGYVPNATDQFELDYDAPLLVLSSDALFTNLETRRLAIQGRQFPLNAADVVQLGMSHHAPGLYTIEVPRREGIFENAQSIYLKDNVTGTWTDLSQNAYTFEADGGLSEGRFEIRYQMDPTLDTDNAGKEGLIVYRSGDRFVVKSTHRNITAVEVFDTAGRLMFTVKGNSKTVEVPAENLPNAVYILKISQAEKVTTRKIIK